MGGDDEDAALQLYAGMVSLFLPMPAENQLGFIADLEGDPFIEHALAVLRACFTTVMHVLGTADGRADHNYALSIWTSMPCCHKGWWRTSQRS